MLAALAAGMGALASHALHAKGLPRCATAFAAGLAACCAVDLPQYLTLATIELAARWRRRSAQLDTLTDDFAFVVSPRAVDRNAHMNNAEYLRLTNVARRRLLARSGVWAYLRADAQFSKTRGRAPLNLVVTAQAIRYRRELRLLRRCRVQSRVVWADDDRSFFIEHRFVAHGFVHALQLVKYRLVGHGSDGGGAPDHGGGGVTPSELLARVEEWHHRGEARRVRCSLAHAGTAPLLVPAQAAIASPHGEAEASASAGAQPRFVGPLRRDVELFQEFDRASSALLRAEARAAGSAGNR